MLFTIGERDDSDWLYEKPFNNKTSAIAIVSFFIIYSFDLAMQTSFHFLQCIFQNL